MTRPYCPQGDEGEVGGQATKLFRNSLVDSYRAVGDRAQRLLPALADPFTWLGMARMLATPPGGRQWSRGIDCAARLILTSQHEMAVPWEQKGGVFVTQSLGCRAYRLAGGQQQPPASRR
jgi:hypothetical protein